MQCTCVRMNMVRLAVMLNSETRTTHVCNSQGLCTHLLVCLFSDILVYMFTAVAYIDRESHVEVDKSDISVHSTTLSMCNAQYKTCISRKCASYAMCMRVCALVLGGKGLFTDFLWAGSVC